MKIKEIREKSGMTQKDVADNMGLSVQTISRYEKGLRSPSVKVLRELCGVLNVSMDYMTDVDRLMTISGKENMIIELYRSADHRTKDDALMILRDHRSCK